MLKNQDEFHASRCQYYFGNRVFIGRPTLFDFFKVTACKLVTDNPPGYFAIFKNHRYKYNLIFFVVSDQLQRSLSIVHLAVISEIEI